NPTAATYLDNGTALGGVLVEDVTALNLQPRLDASLVVDPGTIVKFDGARIETRMGGQLVAEGHVGHEIVFTSLQDDRYGAGGSYDTSNQLANSVAERGDWGGLLIGALGELSLDHAVVSYAGGITKMDGSFAGVNPVELHQATARITNTTFEQNASGVGGQANANRFGRGSNAPGSIFVRGSQPIIVSSTFQHNDSSAININLNSLNGELVSDWGRSTSLSDAIPGFEDNRGPLVRMNRLADNGGIDGSGVRTGANGMIVRGGTLTTEGVWDDTDIVHVIVDETMIVPDRHTFGGLSLRSGASESLVVKLLGTNAGFRAEGRPLDISDRIGGSIHILGQPRFPVILTSLQDDSVGAGLTPDGALQQDTDNGDAESGGSPGGLLPTGP
ncbi:MAG: hypothetical protein KDA55_22620, partial [Planctomycetales bacterium]|nr:hypothetical protein [Planctomycetales bacterium]